LLNVFVASAAAAPGGGGWHHTFILQFMANNAVY
jgi:hypothetical protein